MPARATLSPLPHFMDIQAAVRALPKDVLDLPSALLSPLPKRARSLLTRLDVRHIGDLRRHSQAELAAVRNVGTRERVRQLLGHARSAARRCPDLVARLDGVIERLRLASRRPLTLAALEAAEPWFAGIGADTQRFARMLFVLGSRHAVKHPGRPVLRVTVPMHAGDLKRGTLRSIVRQSGLSIEEFLELL